MIDFSGNTPRRKKIAGVLLPLVAWLDRKALPKYSGTVEISGLNRKVQVSWDRYGVPHVRADEERDLFFAQGYLHAQERLWQMDLARRVFGGRMAEIFGNFAIPWQETSAQFRGRRSVDLDYFMRLIGLRRAAESSLSIMPEPEIRHVEAYSEGVNRYIESCGKTLPWEFRLLRSAPDPWSPADTLTIGKGFAFLLSPALFTRLNTLALAMVLKDQPAMLRSLSPVYPEDAPAITRATWNSAAGLWRFVSSGFNASQLSGVGFGSNNWVVSGQRSASGKPILCNDPHLRLTLPPIWYLMHLQAGGESGYEAWGASIPGSPCIHVGHNRQIAWGITAGLCDEAELYREKLHPLDADSYRVGHEWLAFEHRREIIRVRGARPVVKNVRLSRHGPLISDFDDTTGGGRDVLSFRWTAHDPSREFSAVYGINCARNWEEFLVALSHQTAPVLNYVYADGAGNIGYALAGKIPLRRQSHSLLPLDGSETANDWDGYVPVEQLPRLYNPPEGAIATANNNPCVYPDEPVLPGFFEPPYRIERIRTLLAETRSCSAESMLAMQFDTLSLHAQAVIEIVRSDLAQLQLDDALSKNALERLLSWDGRCNAESVEAALFHAFYYRMLSELLIPVLGEELFIGYVEIFNQCMVPLEEILRQSESAWFQSRPRSRLVRTAFTQAIDDLTNALGRNPAKWRWGRLHTLSFDHNLSKIPLLRQSISLGPFPSSGDNTTVNMGFYRHSHPFQHTVGASLRFVIDWGNEEKSGFALHAGQSGHPSSRHYADQTEMWFTGGLINLSEPVSVSSELVMIPKKRPS